MLVLFDTAAGFAIFKVTGKTADLKNVENIFEHFDTVEGARSFVKLKAFHQFKDTKAALAAATALVAGDLDKGLKSFLKKKLVQKEFSGKLGVSDSKIGSLIKQKLKLKCVNNNKVQELVRGIRKQFCNLVDGIDERTLSIKSRALSHSLSRYKLKFSPEKVDTMIVQAIGLLDDLDKEINTYGMRVKEWYGWHFPELVKLVVENTAYSQLVLKVGMRKNIETMDLTDVLENEDVEAQVKQAARISMGTDITDQDLHNIQSLAEQVLSLYEYRAQLSDYLNSRMQTIAPNLTHMVGELVGARLIAHAGSLLNLAKQPASTVQILGAEKALFRALKTKSDTPKYGLIYHASLIGQATPKNRGKISRVLAAKTSLAIRVDALGETSDVTIGHTARQKVEDRLRSLENGMSFAASGGARTSAPKKQNPLRDAEAPAQIVQTSSAFKTSTDVVVDEPAKPKKRKKSDDDEPKKKKKKKSKKAKQADDDEDDKPKKKKKKKEGKAEKKKKKEGKTEKKKKKKKKE